MHLGLNKKEENTGLESHKKEIKSCFISQRHVRGSDQCNAFLYIESEKKCKYGNYDLDKGNALSVLMTYEFVFNKNSFLYK